MKKIIISFLIILTFFSFSFCENLYPINDEKGGGYINKNGNIVLKQKYNFAERFVGDYAIVQDENLKKGIIDKKGNVVIDFKYNNLDNLSENFVFYKVTRKNSKGAKYGYIDIEKNKRSKPIYDDVKSFKEGLAAVCIDEKWGFIDKKGKYVVEPKYYNVSNFSEGLAAVSYSKNNTVSYINKEGKIVISFKDNALDPKEFHEGLAPVVEGADTACSYIDKKGKVVIDKEKIFPVISYCSPFSEGLAVIYIYKNRKEVTTGFMDKKGNIKYTLTVSVPQKIRQDELCIFENFSSNMAQFTIDYRTGYINDKFELVIPPIYEFARDFDGDLAYVKFEEKEGYINKQGSWVWSKPREGM